MSGVESRAAVAEIAAEQWGLLTTAQAVAAGVPRMMLSRMAERGELERLAQGVYATPAAVGDEVTARRAAWLSLDPGTPAYVRLERPEVAGVVSHASAAAMHDVGDILEQQIEVTLPVRYRPRRQDLRVHRAVLEPGEVTLVEGLPVTTAARTVADLVRAGHDRDHVASVMADALRKDLTSPLELRSALEGVEAGRSGPQVLSELLGAAGLDVASLARSIMTSSVGEAAWRETVNMMASSLRQAVEPLAANVATLGTRDVVLERLREAMKPLASNAQLSSHVSEQAQQIGALLADRWMRESGDLPRVSQWAAEVAPQLAESLDVMKTWRALQLSEQLAVTAAADDEHDDEHDNEHDDERTEATR